jgi:type VI secretion system protein ImpG
MSDELLKYYKEERKYLQQFLSTELAKKHPKIAARLGIGEQTIEDPSLEQLVEAYSLMNARLRHKIEDDFPEVSHTLLTALHPHYQAPIPSMSIVQFEPNLQELTHPVKISKNYEILSQKIKDNPSVPFKTCYDTTVWPIEITEARFDGRPADLPKNTISHVIKSILSITLSCPSKLSFQDLLPDSLRFFISAPKEYAYHLYQWLICNMLQVQLCSPHEPEKNAVCQIVPVGFGMNEGLLPYPPQTMLSQRWLTEFFNLPEKFLFFEIQGLADALKRAQISQECELVFCFDEPNILLEQQLKTDWFALGCTPIINLFEQTLENIQVSSGETQYQLKPSMENREKNTEIYSVLDVNELDAKTQAFSEYASIYGIRHTSAQEAPAGYWHQTRKPAWQGEHYVPEGTEVFLSFMDKTGEPFEEKAALIQVNAQCLYRHISAPKDSPLFFTSAQENKIITSIHTLAPVTPCRWPSTEKYAVWHLLSHLNPNALCFSGEERGAESMREMLRLYDLAQTEHTSFIDGILSISEKLETRPKPRIRGKPAGNSLWKGVEITLTVDKTFFRSTSVFLFGCLLERWLARYVPPSTFTQLTIVEKSGELLCAFQMRAGEGASL